jgi:hypothetical protein
MKECEADRRNWDAIELRRGCCAATSIVRIEEPNPAGAIVPTERL